MDIRPPDHVMAWLGPLIIVNVFVWIIAWTPEANSAICSGDSNCLTDWIGSLSGWIAAGAAYLTIREMNTQRNEANTYQREFVELEIMSRLALARRVERQFGVRVGRHESLRQMVLSRRPGVDIAPLITGFMLAALTLKRDLSSELLQEYNDKIGINCDISADDLRFNIEVVEASISGYELVAPYPLSYPSEIAEAEAEVIESLSICYEHAERFFADLHADVTKFITRWSAKI